MSVNNLYTGLLSKERPVVFDDLHNGQGTHLYNHKINEVPIVEDEQGNIRKAADGEQPTGTGFEYDSLRVEYPINGDNIFKTLLNAKYGSDKENQLRNEYTSAELGILDESYKAPYVAFLRERIALRTMIDEDCQEHDIPIN